MCVLGMYVCMRVWIQHKQCDRQEQDLRRDRQEQSVCVCMFVCVRVYMYMYVSSYVCVYTCVFKAALANTMSVSVDTTQTTRARPAA